MARAQVVECCQLKSETLSLIPGFSQVLQTMPKALLYIFF